MKLLTIFSAIAIATTTATQYQVLEAQTEYSQAQPGYSNSLHQSAPGHQEYSEEPQAYLRHEYQQEAKPVPRILDFNSKNDEHSYQYNYKTENGITAEEVGQTGKENQVHGSYSYLGEDGQTYTVTYVADEHGFRAQGDHLPTPPPLPEAIYKSLEQNARDEANGITDDGQYHEHQSAGHSQGNQEQGYHTLPAQYTSQAHSGYHH